MPTRASIVLLVILNLAAAAWWWLHAPSPAEPPPAVPAGAARLHLASERGAGAVASLAPVAASAAQAGATPAKPAPPKAAAAVAPAAADAVPPPPAASAAAACEGGEGPASGWRVYLPKLANAGAAQATAARIAEAGFSDYLVVRDGEDANSIALGRYGSEAAAQRRVASLRAAGFAARCARIPPATPA